MIRRRTLVNNKDVYLTFKSVTNCTHFFSNTVNYSLDGGFTWQILAANTSLTVTAGNSVMWKATLTPTGSGGIGRFFVASNTDRFDVEGNIMSLLYGDNFIGQTELKGNYNTFSMLFNGNKGVVNAQDMVLPATTLVNSCYYNMFNGCTSLTTAPKLPATTLAQNCYGYMFNGCTSLTIAPKLPATTLADQCYGNMFYNCTSLTTAPELPATTLAYSCYSSMFNGCSSLTTAPTILPATTLANICYYNMFSNCKNLTTAPSLPATTLANSCYGYMFYNCTSLTTAPELPATTLVTSCYQYMFSGCFRLNYIKCMATDISASYCLDRWTYGVAANGTFYKDIKIEFPVGYDGIPSGWIVEEDFVDYLTFTASEDGTFKFTKDGLSYSTDKVNWTALSANTPTPTVSAGDSIYFKGTMKGKRT